MAGRERPRGRARRWAWIGAASAGMAVAVSGCGGSGANAAAERAVQRDADLYGIQQLEVAFHKAMSKKDLDGFISLWAPNATFTVGSGQTSTGKQQIRQYFHTKSKLFQPGTSLVSATPAYKLRSTVNGDGDRGTMYFECNFLDVKTAKVVVSTAADVQLAKIDGRWLITEMVGGSATLSP